MIEQNFFLREQDLSPWSDVLAAHIREDLVALENFGEKCQD